MTDRLAADLVRWALEFHRRRPWDRIPGEAPFLVRLPGEELPLAANVLGQARRDYGLLLLRGAGAFECQVRTILGDDDSRGVVDEWDMLSATFEPLGSIPDEFRGVLRRAGFTARRESVAPFFLGKAPGHQPRPPSRGELRALLWALKGLCAADDAALLRPAPLDAADERTLELSISGELRAPRVEARTVPWPRATPRPASLVFLGPGLEGLPRNGERWHAALLAVPGRIRGEERAVRVFALGSVTRGELVAHVVVLGEELQPAARELTRVLSGQKRGVPAGAPESITFDSARLHDAFAPALRVLGVRTEVGPAPAFLADYQRALLEGAADESAKASEQRASGSLADWKAAELRVTTRLLEETAPAVTERALARYFGSVEIAEDAFDTLAALAPFPAFIEWFLADYRATRGSRTELEKRLERASLSREERTLLEARRDAALSVYRVDSREPGATLTVEDVRSGERRTVNDAALSGCELDDCFLPLRLARVGEWTFAVFAGPPLKALQVGAALALLERTPRSAQAAGPRPDADAFGRIWGWLLESSRNPPRLENTDGDLLECVTATFEVADVERLRTALDARADVHGDGASWAWSRPGGPAPGMGDSTILAHLTLAGSRLVLEVNSRRRLERAREWVDRLPGVRLAETERRPFRRAPRGGVEKPCVELDPALRREIERRVEALYDDWLDQPLPALGNASPRSCCATPDGRRRVAQLVRTLPPIGVPGGSIAPPRERLLRALGLGREG